MLDFARARKNMVENQLRPNRVEDPRLIEAMLSVPREAFVPKSMRGVAYSDDDLSLGDGRRLIEPLALGRLLQALEIQPTDIALVLGCDTGYTAAVMSRLAATVFLLVPEGASGDQVGRTLDEQGCDNVVLQHGPLAQGLPSQAPFDVVLLAGSVPAIPQQLLDQLGEGGRLAAVVRNGSASHITVCRRYGPGFGRVTPFDAWLPELPEFRAPPRFEF